MAALSLAGCNKNVAVALISMHNCSLDAKIRGNLEAQVVETQTEAKKKPAEKKKSTSEEPKSKRVKKAKDEKKSSKRPLTAFVIFMNDFRITFKRENPYVNVKDVAKQGGEKWKSMSEEEKKVYQDRAAELKAAYVKSLENSDTNEEEEDEEMQSDDAENTNEDNIEAEEEEEILDDY